MISPEILKRFPYFAMVGEESLRTIAQFSEEVGVEAGTPMFKEGEKAPWLYIIRQGEIDIQYTLGDGSSRVVDTLVPGDLLVWSSLLPPYKTRSSGLVTKDLQLIRMDAAALRQLCEQDTAVGYRLMTQVVTLLANRLDGARTQLATLDAGA